MDSRRDFLKKATLLAGGSGLSGILPESIRKALAIDPVAGSTYLDAEHVVILMQENRSFDHAFGTLQGVRGFDDPRAIQLPDGRPVWLQSNAAGQTFAPFRLNIRDSNATWLGSLPHSWTDQVDARNGGKHDRWLDAKRSGHPQGAGIPLTLGYYTREDLPFYYALADAFTVCDQHFCSSLTGTTPNRLYLWTGTIRAQPSPAAKANVRNEDLDYDRMANWHTFPERLEDAGISWKIYQNEISLPTGLDGEQDAWLANFTDNPLEWFDQYRVRFAREHFQYLQEVSRKLSGEIQQLTQQWQSAPVDSPERQKATDQLREKDALRTRVEEDLIEWDPKNFDNLPARDKNLHEKAFTNNRHDPHYRELTTIHHETTPEGITVPAGDVLHQFRADVANKTLPTVSWLVAPERFSDHPGAPWYGAWYVSEVLDILTQNPEVWKKTIFILTYDENDGYFDHQPPFVPPHPDEPESGRASATIDTSTEFVYAQQEQQRGGPNANREARTGPIGLGFRVPLLIASPWSRGGQVCSQVFDHTSVLQFLEHWLGNRSGQVIRETNISPWRRAVCGDLRRAFRPYLGGRIALPGFLEKEKFIESIYQARLKPVPTGFVPLDAAAIEQLKREKPLHWPRQEKGMRPSCALPYELYADGRLDAGNTAVRLRLSAGNTQFGTESAGAPFLVYAPGSFATRPGAPGACMQRAYTVAAGDEIADTWPLNGFEQGQYHLRLYGPNGFFREFRGGAQDPGLDIQCAYERDAGGRLNGRLELRLHNTGTQPLRIRVQHHAYGYAPTQRTLDAGARATLSFDLKKSHRWYDLGVQAEEFAGFEQRFAGRVETGETGWTDPLIGQE